ncbi:hypothetical protein [Amycolatopsis sp. H20-H5]|nr:hypothetical protein [Amycolatopsis sp. H20-H5]MEC3977718.1 hypothetical protein [Amycolatopsis sp. H20-H5]
MAAIYVDGRPPRDHERDEAQPKQRGLLSAQQLVRQQLQLLSAWT